jgi:protein-S-isoprenylcysteine O-methyltransferase Ste14
MALQEEFEKQGNWLFRYRSILPIVILLIGIAINLQTEFHPETFILQQPLYVDFYEFFCLLVSLLGLGIRIYTVGHTLDWTSGRNTSEGQVAIALNTTGIYSIVRHPLYLGNFFMWLGPALLNGQIWFIASFCMFYWIYYERIMYAEEQFLRGKFNAEYTNWAQNVPAFIPSFRNFVKPKIDFSWIKVTRNEKNGLVSVFFIFCVFDIAGAIIQRNNEYNYFFLIGFAFSFLFFVVIQYLKKRTKVFSQIRISDPNTGKVMIKSI